MQIALIGLGEMGAAVGGRLVRRGASVAACVAGRSAASIRRAEDAGVRLAPDERALLANAELVLSILPPGEALPTGRRLAEQLKGRGGRTAYADCNAVAPAVVRQIGDVLEAAGAPFIDVGIVGPPPWGETDGARFYASGSSLDRIEPLASFGVDLRPLPGAVGQASALKMAYASLTKGLAAVGANLGAFDLEPEILSALNAEFRASQPELSAWLARMTPTIHAKAYRWVNEMEQIAATLGETPGAGIYEAAARFYQAVAADYEAGDTAKAEQTAALLKAP